MNPSFALNLAVSNVICALVFGHRFSTEDKTFHLLLESIEKIFNVSDSVAANTKTQPKSPYDEKNMVQSIFDLFLGGTETAGTTLYWGLLYMVLYPDVQAKVQQEIDTLLTPGQSVCYEDRKKLPYTNAVVHEIQRFSNIISIGMPRYCLRDTKIRNNLMQTFNFHLADGSKDIKLDPVWGGTLKPRSFDIRAIPR
ncbi:Cytochrome protein, partial [Ophiophagus hannah]